LASLAKAGTIEALQGTRKKEAKTEQQGEHPTEEGAVHERTPTKWWVNEASQKRR